MNNRYITSVGQTVADNAEGFPPNVGLSNSTTSTWTQSTNSITLSSIPDKLIICVRIAPSAQNMYQPDAYLPISNISINFNNQAGLLSTASQYQLHNMSVRNGLLASFDETRGYSCNGSAYQTTNTDWSANGIAISFPKTCGTVLCLAMGKDIPLSEMWYSAGSIGSFVLQMTLSGYSMFEGTLNPDEFEVLIIPVFSGCVVMDAGSSSTFTGLLDRKSVLDCKQQENPIYETDVNRIIGCGLSDTIKSAFGSVVQYGLPLAVKVLEKKLGLGESGGNMDMGMGASGGARRKKLASHLLA
jgi:hypothetical protein